MKTRYFFLLMIFFVFSCNHNKKQINHTTKQDISYYKKANKFYHKNQLDSAYYYYNKSLKKHLKINDSLYIAKAYLNLSIIDYFQYDLPNAEYNAIQVLKFAPSNKLTLKISAINILGISANAKQNYSEAIQYFKQFRKIYTQQKDTLKKFITYHNNLGNVYKKMKLFDKAIYHYNLILNLDSLQTKYPGKYARALDNKAWCEFKSGLNNTKILNELLESYQIRKKIKNDAGIVISSLHLAQYHLKQNQIQKARQYAQEALIISKQNHFDYNTLEALDLLTDIQPQKTYEYHKAYKSLQDSIINTERRFKDYAAKIRYESFEKEKQLIKNENEIKLKTKKTLFLTIILTILSLAFLLSLYLYSKINQKNKLLKIQAEKLQKKKAYIELVHQEMHHRIKNNFLNILHFLSKIKKSKDLNKLQKLENTILNVYKIHELLKDKPVESDVNLKEYLEIIIEQLKKTIASNIKISLKIDPNIRVPFKKIISILIIINEFINNSDEHAFDNQANPEIKISAYKSDNMIVLELSDNGKGLPKDFDYDRLSSDGFKIIKNLAEELEGSFNYINEKGLKIIIKFLNK